MRARTLSPASSSPKVELIPKAEESYNHTARVCRVGPDNKLYIQLGQPYNVPSKEKNDLYRKLGIGGITRMDRDGKNREVYAIGLRNPVGMDFNPKDKSLWTNDNQVDGMGDDQPPGELNRIASAGLDFGFPWYGGGKICNQRVQERYAAGQCGFSGSGAGRRCRGSRPDFLHRHDVPTEIPRRNLLDAARLVESDRAGRRDIHGASLGNSRFRFLSFSERLGFSRHMGRHP